MRQYRISFATWKILSAWSSGSTRRVVVEKWQDSEVWEKERGPWLQANRSWNLDPTYALSDTAQIVNFLICKMGLKGLSKGIKIACKKHSIAGDVQLA